MQLKFKVVGPHLCFFFQNQSLLGLSHKNKACEGERNSILKIEMLIKQRASESRDSSRRTPPDSGATPIHMEVHLTLLPYLGLFET